MYLLLKGNNQTSSKVRFLQNANFEEAKNQRFFGLARGMFLVKIPLNI